jgi:serine/threonine protein kinase
VFNRQLVRISDSTSTSAYSKNEVRVIGKLGPSKHRNIVHVLETGSLSLNQKHYFYIDMEFCDLALSQYLDRNDNWAALCAIAPESRYFSTNVTDHQKTLNGLRIMRDIADGLSYIHSLHKTHGDLSSKKGLDPTLSH